MVDEGRGEGLIGLRGLCTLSIHAHASHLESFNINWVDMRTSKIIVCLEIHEGTENEIRICVSLSRPSYNQSLSLTIWKG